MVGRFGGGDAALLQLAALGPATMLIDSLLYLTYFLSIATTSKMAKALAQRDYKSLQTTSSHIMGVAGILGFCVLALVFGMGRTLLTWSAGSSGSPQLIGAALEYSRIRCAVAPLSIVGMVAQSICLSVRDTTTPAVAVAVASIVNIVGDFCLVPRMGLTGAAIATAAASTSSTLVLLKSVRNKALDWRQKESEATGTNGLKAHVVVNGINATKVTTTVVDGKPVLYNDTVTTRNTTISGSTGTAVASDTTTTTRTSTLTSSQIPFISLPDRTSLLQLVQLAGPIFFVIVGKVVCYSAMTLKATNFGLSNVAAHNIMMRVFFFHATFGDSLTQAAQTFLPQTLLEKNTTNLKKLLKKLLVLATVIGVLNWISIQWVLHNCGSVFTSNLDIIRIMAANSSPMALATFFHSFVMVFEGSIIATGDFRYLVSTYAITMAVLFGQLKFATPHFGGVWTALLVFQTMRLVQFKTRVFSKVLWRKSRETLTAVDAL
jgi:Na+-driven multidrug efflux pump